ncbi:MAG: hypothetical protein ABI969_12505 [bacterium]
MTDERSLMLSYASRPAILAETVAFVGATTEPFAVTRVAPAVDEPAPLLALTVTTCTNGTARAQYSDCRSDHDDADGKQNVVAHERALLGAPGASQLMRSLERSAGAVMGGRIQRLKGRPVIHAWVDSRSGEPNIVSPNGVTVTQVLSATPRS